MKLCIVTQNIIKGDGQGRVNYEVAWEAADRGHQVTLLACRVSPQLQQHPHIRWVPIAGWDSPTNLLKILRFSKNSADWLRQHGNEFDLIQSNGAATSADAEVNVVHFVHSSWLKSPAHTSRQYRNYYGAYQWLYTRLNAYWEKQALRRSMAVIAVSEKVKKELSEIGISEDRICTIINGVDLQEFSPQKGDRSTLGLPAEVPIALFVGDIRNNRKNLDTVLHALVQVPELHLAVVGSTEQSIYPQLAETLGLKHRVHFLGYRRDVPAIMQAVDFFVFPSRYEACSLVILEAMASGLPIITALTAGGAEIVTPEAGIVLPDSEDTLALATGLKQLTKDCQLRQKMGSTARAIAEQHSWRSMASNYVDLFEALLESKISLYQGSAK